MTPDAICAGAVLHPDLLQACVRAEDDAHAGRACTGAQGKRAADASRSILSYT